MRKQFIHLRVHSSYSLSEGAITPNDIIKLCIRNNMPAVAVTDTNNLFGSLEFTKAAFNQGIQPIIGSLVRIGEGIFLPLLAQDEIGYQNLLKIVSYSYLNSNNFTSSIEEIEKYNEGIICLSGYIDGPIGSKILSKNKNEAEKNIIKLKDIFADRFYLELQRHERIEEEEIEPFVIEMAYKYNIPLVATNDVFFATEDIYEAHDALTCIADARYVVEDDRKKFTKNHYFKSQSQMYDLFSDIPEAIYNTVEIAKRCAVASTERDPILPNFSTDISEAEELKNQAFEGLEERLNDYLIFSDTAKDEKQKIMQPYIERLEYELDVIIKMDFPGYFLIVSDFIKWSKKNEIPVGPGRGSGAGSLIAWVMQITDLDPLRYGLLFERFLNPERVSMPDFDIDFCQEKRDQVIKYVQQRYGKERVAQIITFGKLQARAVIRDVGRVLQVPYGKVDKISKMIPFNPINPVTLSQAIEMDRVFKEETQSDQETSKLVNIALKLEGLNRHASTHAAGVVIADRPLEELIPVYRDPKSEMPVTGYSMKYAESAGLVKFDFLGLKTLTVIDKAVRLIRKYKEFDISTIAIDDQKTYKMLSEGNSVGVFQLESAGMQDTLRKLRPDKIEDIIALISLYRPGPMDNIPTYIKRKHGEEEPDYPHELLKEALEETFGVIIYQEQVMQIAQILSGYSLGAADLLRRAMGKKIAAEMDAQREIFVEGAVENKIDRKKADSIFDLVAKFAGYGFNKSHAAAYALISYQTGYLKANYPVEFFAASMNLEILDTDKINLFYQDAIRNKIKMLPPDVNKSGAYFAPEGKDSIRYGLGALKNVSIQSILELESKRQREFTDIFDFFENIENKIINKRQFESLAKSGSFDNIHPNRRELFENTEMLLNYANNFHEEKNSGQLSMFTDTHYSKPKLVSSKSWNKIERMNMELESIGLYLNDHPISEYNGVLKKIGITNSSDFESLADGNSSVKIAGVVISKKIRSSARGRFATIRLSDPASIYEISAYNEDLLANSRDLLEAGKIVVIYADIRKDEGGVRITASNIISIESEANKYESIYEITIEDNISIIPLKNIISGLSKGRSRIRMITQAIDKKISIELPEGYMISPMNISDIAEIAGLNIKEL